MANNEIRVLIVEDSEDDAQLLLRHLRQGGYEPVWEMVSTAEAMEQALARGRWDIVISDYIMPHFNGMEALKILQRKDEGLPFIVVSGKIGEEVAVEAMKAGANDYLMKNSLQRLTAAVGHAVKASENRIALKRAEDDLRQKEKDYRALFENAGDAIFIADAETEIILDMNKLAEKMLGKPREEIIGKNRSILHPPNGGYAGQFSSHVKSKQVSDAESIVINNKGEHIPVRISAAILELNGRKVIQGIFRDISARKEAEAELKTTNLELQKTRDEIDDALKISERSRHALLSVLEDEKAAEKELSRERAYLKHLFAMAPEGIVVHDQEGKLLQVNQEFLKMFGYVEEEVLGQNIDKLIVPEEKYQEACKLTENVTKGQLFYVETVRCRKNGALMDVSIIVAPIIIDGRQTAVYAIYRDISSRKAAEAALRESDTRYRELFNNISSGVAIYDVLDDGKDFIFKDFNKAGERMDEDSRKNVIGKNVLEARPGIKEFGLYDVFRRVWRTGVPEKHPVSHYQDERVSKWFENYVYKLPSGEIVAVYDDVTESKKAEEELRDSEHKFRTLFENMAQGVFYQKADGTLTDINRAGLQMFGLTKDQFLGRTSYDSEWKVINDKYELLQPEEHPSMVALRSGKEIRDMVVGVYNPIDKEYRWLSVNAMPRFKTAIDKPYQVFVTLHDLTEIKRAEAALMESEDKFKYVFENSVVGKTITMPDGLLSPNKAFCSLLGYSADELNMKKWTDITHPDDIEMTRRELEKLLSREKASIRIEKRYLRKDGRTIWADVSSVPRFDEKGKIVYFMTSVIDITDRKKAEEALKKAEWKYRILVDTSPDGITQTDVDGSITYVSQQAVELYGANNISEILGTNVMDYIHTEDQPKASMNIRNVMQGIYSKDNVYRLVKKNGNVIWGEIKASVLTDDKGRPLGMVAITRDISERIKADRIQQALYNIADAALGCRDLQQLYIQIHSIIKKLLPANNFYIAIYDSASDIISFPYYQDEKNDYTVPRRYGKGLTEYIISTKKALLVNHEIHNQLRSEGKAEFIGHPSKHWLGVPLISENKAFGTLVIQSYDERTYYTSKDLELLNFVADHVASAIISAKTRQDLAESEERYRTFIDSTEDMAFLKDEKLKYLLLNKANALFLGKPIEELLGRSDDEIMAPELAEQCRRSDMKALKENDIMVVREEFNGRHYESRKFPVRLASGKTGVGGYVRDITDLVRAEQSKRLIQMELEQSQKMEAIGHLAGGVAHDFNNMLTGILGNAEILQYKLSGNQEAEGPIDNIIRSAGHAANLTRQLLAFARKGQYQLVPVNVHKVIGETANLLSSTIDKRISVEQSLRANPSTILGDPTQLENCLMNLGINARDAMPNGGRLVYSTELVTMDRNYIELHQYKIEPGDYIQITVSDNGTGMGEEVKKHLFEPFFTTKEPGKGTGLGLAGAYGCIKNHGGSIEVYSEQGYGTAIKMYLPLHRQEAEAETAAAAKTLPRGTGTIMIVDDEEVIRSIASQLLEDAGYKVISCPDGIEALRVYRDKSDGIDLVILDMIMPHKNGRETFFALQEINPRVRALLSSGFTEDTETQEIIKAGARGFIQKPYRSSELIAKVQQALSQE